MLEPQKIYQVVRWHVEADGLRIPQTETVTLDLSQAVAFAVWAADFRGVTVDVLAWYAGAKRSEEVFSITGEDARALMREARQIAAILRYQRAPKTWSPRLSWRIDGGAIRVFFDAAPGAPIQVAEGVIEVTP